MKQVLSISDTAWPLDKHPAFDAEDAGDLAVVLCHFNPCQYKTPVCNLARVLDWLFGQDLPVYAAELRCGSSVEVAPVLPSLHPHVLQLVSDCVLFQKEHLWNLTVKRLPTRYHKVLCLDADIILMASNWHSEISRLLDQFPLAHPYSRVVWSDKAGYKLSERFSSGYGVAHSLPGAHDPRLFHPGLAIAARRSLWEQVGGLYNGPIGNGDWMLVSAALGTTAELRDSLEATSLQYWRHYECWATKLWEWAKGNLACIDSDAIHLWHGSKGNRHYIKRVDRIAGFDPITDLEPNRLSGLPEWTAFAHRNKPTMISAIADYFTIRHEDD